MKEKRKKDVVGRIPDCRAVSRRVLPGFSNGEIQSWCPSNLLEQSGDSQECVCTVSLPCSVTGWEQPARTWPRLEHGSDPVGQ